MPQVISVATLDETRALIQSGGADDALEQIAEWVAARRQAIRRPVQLGARVRIVGKTNPRYLEGSTWTVVRINRTTVSLQQPEAAPQDHRNALGAGRFAYGLRIEQDRVEVIAD